MPVLWLIALLGSVAGALFLFMALAAQGAPQEAAGAALAIAFAVIPYCLARAVEKMKGLPPPRE